MAAKLRTLTQEELSKEHLTILREIGRTIGVSGPTSGGKDLLIDKILKVQSGEVPRHVPNGRGAKPKMHVNIDKFLDKSDDLRFIELGEKESGHCKGVFAVNEKGGFLHSIENSPGAEVPIDAKFVEKYKLRQGDRLTVEIVKKDDGLTVKTINLLNGKDPMSLIDRSLFDELKQIYPHRRIDVSNGNAALRAIDMFAPMGFGQRTLIGVPPKADGISLLKNISAAINENFPAVKVTGVLIGGKPEDKEDMVGALAGVEFSGFFENAERHVFVAESALDGAKRIAEDGGEVVMLISGMTELAKAYSEAEGDKNAALYKVKRYLSAARGLENGGSVTIVFTAAFGSSDEFENEIYNSLSSVCNTEIKLNRPYVSKNAINFSDSFTAKSELLLTEEENEVAEGLKVLLYKDAALSDVITDLFLKSANKAEFLKKSKEMIKIKG